MEGKSRDAVRNVCSINNHFTGAVCLLSISRTRQCRVDYLIISTKPRRTSN